MPDRIEGNIGDEADDVNVGKNIRSQRSEGGRQTVTIAGDEWGAFRSAFNAMQSDVKYFSREMDRLRSIEHHLNDLREKVNRLLDIERDVERLRVHVDSKFTDFHSRINNLWLVGALVVVGILAIGAITMWLYLTPNLATLGRQIDLNDRRIERIEQRVTPLSPPFLPGVTP